jgi:hypothetical protein
VFSQSPIVRTCCFTGLDNGPIHVGKATRAALAERNHWLTPEWMVKYAPELNDIEREWKTLKAHHLAHKTFKNRDDLKVAIDADIEAINSTRKSQLLARLCLARVAAARHDVRRAAARQHTLVGMGADHCQSRHVSGGARSRRSPKGQCLPSRLPAPIDRLRRRRSSSTRANCAFDATPQGLEGRSVL